jgi:hypothetical protein
LAKEGRLSRLELLEGLQQGTLRLRRSNSPLREGESTDGQNFSKALKMGAGVERNG